MGNLAQWAKTDPAQVANLEQSLGLPADGQWDPELAKRVEAYQRILGQNPGETSDTDGGQQFTDLIHMIQQRGAAFGPGGDSTPMQDTAFQSFLRNAGAQESDLLDQIQFKTDQTNRDINRHAAGLQADRADVNAQYGQQAQQLEQQRAQAAQQIGQNFGNRGLAGASAQGYQTEQSNQQYAQQQSAADIAKAARLGQLDTQGMEYATKRRDALAAAARQTQSDILSLYRRRADEELAARDRLGLKSAQGIYTT